MIPAMDLDALIDAWEAAWSGRDAAAFEAVCHPGDFHYEDPLTPEPLESVAALAAHAERLVHGRIRPRDEAVEGHRDVERQPCHRASLVSRDRRGARSRSVLRPRPPGATRIIVPGPTARPQFKTGSA